MRWGGQHCASIPLLWSLHLAYAFIPLGFIALALYGAGYMGKFKRSSALFYRWRYGRHDPRHDFPRYPRPYRQALATATINFACLYPRTKWSVNQNHITRLVSPKLPAGPQARLAYYGFSAMASIVSIMHQC